MKTKKIIIKVWDGVDEGEACMKVAQVIANGRISDHGKCYCYATTFASRIAVYAATTKTGSDVFQVCRDRS